MLLSSCLVIWNWGLGFRIYGSLVWGSVSVSGEVGNVYRQGDFGDGFLGSLPAVIVEADWQSKICGAIVKS